METPNIDAIGRALLAMGDTASFSVQPSTIRPCGMLWSASYRRKGAFFYGSGDTLAEAVSNITCISPAASVPSVDVIESAAA